MSRNPRDHGPSAEVGLRERLRGVAASPRLVIGGTVAVLLVVVPACVVVGLLVAGTLWDDGGAVALLAMLLVGGVAAVASVLHEGGRSSALQRIARRDGLELVQATAAPEYAGSLFADGSHVVDQSVRTRRAAFTEVGDRFPTSAPHARYDAVLDHARVGDAPEPLLFLRGRLAGHVPTPEVVTLGGVLGERLTRFAGEHTIELARDEVTVYGSRRLDAQERGRAEEAFGILDDVVAEVDQRFGGTAAAPRDEPPAAVRRPRPTRRPLRLVGLTLGLFVVVPLGFAFVMSIVDDLSDSRVVAVLAVNVLIAVTGASIALLLRRATAAARADGATSRRRRWAWAVGAVAFVALGVVAVSLDQSASDIDDSEKRSAAECGTDDPWCQQEVSTRVWAEDHGLTRGELDWQACVRDVGVDRSTCPVRLQCSNGHADLVAELAGRPLEVVGVRAAGSPSDLRRSTAEVRTLVGQECRPSTSRRPSEDAVR